MIVNYQKPIEFVNDCGCLVDYKELEKAILWYTEKPVVRLKKIYLHGRYPAVSIHKEKIHIHRLMMMYWENRRLDRSEHVHHKNENRLDANRLNLKIIQDSKHMSLHNKDKRLTPTHRKKISLANKRRKGMKLPKRVDIPADELRTLLESNYSINKIAKHFNCDWSTVKSRIHENQKQLEGQQ